MLDNSFYENYSKFLDLYPESQYISFFRPKIEKVHSKSISKISFIETNDNWETLEDIISSLKGKPIYIDIWATWCGPCINEFSYLEKFREKTIDMDFIHLFLSVDEDKNEDKWKNAVNYYDLQGYNYRVNTAQNLHLQKRFGDNNAVLAIPRCIIIGKDGNIVFDNAAGISENKIIEQLKSVL